MRFSILLVLFLLPVSMLAQSATDINLAEAYFNRGEYEKAELYYKKIYNKSRQPAYFDRYITCLERQDKIEEATKKLDKEIKKNPNQVMWLVKIGELEMRLDNERSAKKSWDEALRHLNKSPGNVVTVAREFASLGQNEYALEAYEIGKRNLQGFYTFNIEIAELYGAEGNFDKMVDLYLELIAINPAYLQSVQNMLNRNFNLDDPWSDEVELIRKRLLIQVNQNPENETFAEMLIWMYMKIDDYQSAFIQVKALDRRMDLKGQRMIRFARLARKNRKYDVSKQAYTYVSKAAPVESSLWYIARVERLSVSKDQLDVTPGELTQEYGSLASDYQELLNTMYISDQNVQYYKEWAEVLAYRVDQSDSALVILQKIVDNGGVNKENKARVKIQMGDIYIMRNEVWDAALYYMQAEKAFKYDELGDVAKLRAAKIAYYTGDFQWAEAQLDVLKGSTSKLTANDALYLSNLITDNTGLDTSFVAMEMFAAADLYVAQKRYEEALKTYDLINIQFPGHMLTDDIWMRKYQVAMERNQIDNAKDALLEITSKYSYDILGDDALFHLAKLCDERYDEPEKAKEIYFQFLNEYPSSLYIDEARENYRRLRGDFDEPSLP
jgi:tetratricopeptide (TPR) repeat protein